MASDAAFKEAVSVAELQARAEMIEEAVDAQRAAVRKEKPWAVLNTLYNLDPENWKDRRHINFGFTPEDALRKFSEMLGFMSPTEMLERPVGDGAAAAAGTRRRRRENEAS